MYVNTKEEMQVSFKKRQQEFNQGESVQINDERMELNLSLVTVF